MKLLLISRRNSVHLASFPKVVAYTVAHDISVPTVVGKISGENRLRRLLGKEKFLEAIYLNFAEIVAVFLGSFDQESAVENYWKKEAGLAEAARVMEEIKTYGHLDVQLPPDQQPTFKGKFLTRQIEHLCSRTDYELVSMWTPAFVAFQARKLLNSAHPAFGPLHACSVLRKLRVLICLSGRQALADYPLEMLLSSMRTFISDPECADDALGISRYLIMHGDLYLKGVPTFIAGYGLSTLADLRVFLESSQSSTTQESQFKATKSKAQVFHTWLTERLTAYESSAFTDDQQRMAFGSIIQAAAHIRASGNAEKGTNESNLLLEILKDGAREKQLLSQSARDVALAMLCGKFQIPLSADMDIIDSDEMALEFSTMVWRTCEATGLSPDYLSWAGRAIGRSFAASGNIDDRLVRESVYPEQLSNSNEEEGSEPALLRLLERLSSDGNDQTAGLAEAALRVIVSDAELRQDSHLLAVAQQTISDALFSSCSWSPYGTAPSDQAIFATLDEAQIFDGSWLESPRFAETLATHAAQSVATETLLVGVLPGILANVKEFAEQSFPFIIHLALLHQVDKQQGLKKQLSAALQQWLGWTVPTSMANLKLLIRTILYLRTQPLPNERSIADRAGWLDVSYADAAAAASRCGLFKIAMLFSEIAFSETARSSRRSSVGQHLEDWTEVLLKVFENLDDPDTRYGLPQEPSLDSVLTRVQYEKDGHKTLAFMGAQFDSHLRLKDSASDQDSKSLVKALSSLGLAGLSYSLRQAQQIADTSSAEVTDTFGSSRRIEKWNLPVGVGYSNDSATLYKTYQTIHNAAEMSAVRRSIYDALGQIVQHCVTQSLSAPSLRRQLAALAALTELDDVLSISGAPDLDNVLHKFDARSKWMMSGRYDDVSQILSTRETTLSMLSQKSLLRNATKLSAGEARLGQVRAMLLSSDIFRFHHEHQESLNIATSLSHLIDPSRDIGLVIDVAVRMEVAHALWDQDETITSIRMLQSIDGDTANLKKQTLPISRSELLSRLAHQVSVARLESADTIQKRYLEPALKELRGSSSGKEAGQVYHQFARFCDEQLQNPDSLKDLERLQGLKRGKSEEVQQLKSLIASAKDSQHRQRYTGHLSRAKQWLDLDQQELRRVEQTRSEFLRLSLENYLLSLTASDEHNNDALRFTALWLERSGEDITNEAVKRYLDAVPTRKFAPLMNQLSSRVQNQSITFQKLLMTLVYRICVDHPYHGMYQIWSGVKTRVNEKDEVAVLRQKATEKISQQLAKTSSVAATWAAIDKTSIRYHALAVDRDQSRYKAGQKAQLKDSVAGQNLITYLTRYPIPPPTLQIELAADMDYSHVPNVAQLDPTMTIASGVSAPKIITAIGTDGQRYKQLVKGGNDDLRQDAIMEQVFAAVSELLKLHRDTRQRSLGIRTYKVLPLTASSGLIEFVSDTIPLHEYLMPAHERYYPKDLKGSQCRKEISGVQTKSVETRIETYRRVAQRFHPVMRFFFMEYFADPDEWFAKRTNYTRTTAAISILGHILGLGDRHGHNILLDSKNGEVVHIDLGVAFEMGRVLPVPELVPFRLTRDIVDGMGITKTEGVFRRCCEFTLDALREEAYSIMTILDVLRYDPLYTWSISPVRLAKLQNQRQNADENETGTDGAGGEPSAIGGIGSRRGEGVATTTTTRPEKSEADRALELVSKKLSKTLSVTATVNDLINQATDERNLAVLYSGE
jgi:serine-protein kinase ATM